MFVCMLGFVHLMVQMKMCGIYWLVVFFHVITFDSDAV
jgi:hypothetical protein